MIENTKTNYRIVGINLLVMVGYTLLSRLIGKNDGVLLCAFAIAGQVIICFTLCVGMCFTKGFKKDAGMWLLSAIAVLLVGFGTCMAVFSI